MPVFKRAVGKVLMSAFILGLFIAANSSRSAEVSKIATGKNTEKSKPPTEKYIVKDGIPQGKIFFSACPEKTLVFAAEELRHHLKIMSGADVEMSWRGITSNDGGFLLKARPENEWKGKESAQAFKVEESVSPAPLVTITGNTSLAVLYGVYQYLGDQGVRWLTPGEIGTNIPRLSDIPVRPGKKTCTPSFSSRTLALSSTADNHFGGAPDIRKAVYDYELYLIRNRTQLGRNISTKDFAFDLCGTQSGHAVKPMTGLSAADIGKEPERFALVTGPDFVQKRRFDGGQICFSNEKNIRTAIENCVAYFAKLDNAGNGRSRDLDEDFTVPMGLSDCNGICECENCAKIAGKEPNSKDRLVWWFWNRVAKGLNEKMPGRKIAVFAPYMDITCPPSDVKIEPNIMAVTCQVLKWEKNPENQASYPFPKSFLENITRIRDAGATLGCYDYQNYPWTPTPLQVLDSVQGYAKLGYKHYHMEAMQRTEYDWPIIWSIAQFTWDSSKNPREYLKEFCREYYGTPYDADVLWLLDEMTRNAFALERINYGQGSDTSAMLPDGLIKNARTRLNAAVRNSQGKQQERLTHFRDAIETQFQHAETYRAYSRALNSRSAADIADFTKRATGLRDFWLKNNLNMINSNNRNPFIAAEIYLKTDFANMKPAARKELAGLGPKDELWMKELFAGADKIPEKIPNLLPLPENWKFNLDYECKGLENGYFKVDYDDSKGWQPVSTWSFPSSQGYSQMGGDFWYRIRFNAPSFPNGKKVFLRIGSLDDSGDVYINGVKAGSQSDPANWDKSFEIDVTKEIRPGAENVLAVHGYDCGGGEGVWRPSALYTE